MIKASSIQLTFAPTSYDTKPQLCVCMIDGIPVIHTYELVLQKHVKKVLSYMIDQLARESQIQSELDSNMWLMLSCDVRKILRQKFMYIECQAASCKEECIGRGDRDNRTSCF
jgi:hypothetical protein